MKKICIIGHFGFGKVLLNGQTIKTRMITEEIEHQFGKESLVLLDLAGGIKRIPYLLFKIPFVLSKCDNLIMMPVENGLKFLTPLLRVWNSIFKRKLHYVVIGGWLPAFISDKKWLKKGLCKFHGVYVETNTMKLALKKYGLNHVFVLPNCKKLDILPNEKLVYAVGVPFRLCTFSRVMREKGIEDAVNAVMTANAELGFQAFSLDIYGQIDRNQTEWFDILQKKFPYYIRYGGSVPFNKSTEVLKDYFALLFPTYYEGEGFAGTLIDAFSAGVPVIASDWKYNPEIVNEDVGYVYPTGNQTAFISILKSIAINPSLILSKKTRCIEEANKYRVDKAVQVLIRELED